MLLKNTQVRTVSFDKKNHLIPGVNELEDSRWVKLKSRFGKQIDAMIDEGLLVVITDIAADYKEEPRLTVAVIKETYDMALLQKWLPDSHGRIKGAILRQIEVMKLKKKDDDKENDGDGGGDGES